MSDKRTPFPCTACGLCCKNVHKSEQTAFLDRGDGVCYHFDEQTHLCQIYETRPLVCRVDEFYDTYLKDEIKWDGFVKINLEICKKIQNDILQIPSINPSPCQTVPKSR